jgi:hypothetical protein
VEIIALPEAQSGVVTVNVTLLASAATATLAGAIATRSSLLESAMIAPPVGAGPLRVTVPIEEAPPETLVGLRLTDDNVGGVMVRTALRITPRYVAAIVARLRADTEFVATVNVAVVAPAATVTAAGTVALAVLSLESATAAPPAGAAALSVTVPIEALPPATLVGLTVRKDRLGAIVRMALLVTPP